MGWGVVAAALCTLASAMPVAAQRYLASPADAGRLNDLTSRWETPRTRVLGPFHNLYNARVVRVADRRYPYRMWFFGWAAHDNNLPGPGGDAIYHARSRDMAAWEVYAGDAQDRATWDTSGKPELWAPVLARGTRTFDNAAVGDPSVVVCNGTYHMAYSSVGFEPHVEMTPQRMYITNCVMGATSRDGIHWRTSERPLLLWEGETANRWDISAKATSSFPPDGHYGSYHRPSLALDGTRWRLWFDYYHPGTFLCGGEAECRGDFMNPAVWRVLRSGRDPILRDWPNTSVVKAGRVWYALSDAPGFPEALGGDGRQITVARSDDGREWRVLGHVRPEGLASSHVPEALAVRDEGGAMWLTVFYAWKPETQPGAAWDYRYKEMRWMRMRLTDADMRPAHGRGKER